MNQIEEIEVGMPQRPFQLLYADLKRELINAVQDSLQKGLPSCVVNDIVADVSRQCVAVSDRDYQDAIQQYDIALNRYNAYLDSKMSNEDDAHNDDTE